MVHGLAATTLGAATSEAETQAFDAPPSLPGYKTPTVPGEGSRGHLAVAGLSPVVEGSEVTDNSPYPVPEGVCKVCVGAQVTRTELVHNCTNCSGRGYCKFGPGSNRFDCPFCKGSGGVTYTYERLCEACAGTGRSRRPSLQPVGAGEADAERPRCEFTGEPELRGADPQVVRPRRLTTPCLLNFVGLPLLIAGFACFVGEQWIAGGIVGAFGIVYVATAMAHRVLRPSRDHEAILRNATPTVEEDDGSPRRPDPKASLPLSSDQLVTMATFVALPNVLLLYFFSDIGIGVQVYSVVAPHHMNLLGDVFVSTASLFVGVLAIFDWLNWPTGKKVWAAAVPFLLMAVGCILKGRKYSWAPVLMVLFLIPFSLGLLRTYSCRHVMRSSFYKAAGTCLIVCAVALLAVWLVWITAGGHGWDDDTKRRLRTDGWRLYEYVYAKQPLSYERHCGHSKDLSAFTKKERPNVGSACSTAATILFLAYANPFVGFVVNGIMAAFCLLERAVPDVRDVGRVQQVTQLFFMAIVLVVAGFYASVFVSSASFRLGSMLLAFLAAGFVGLLVWGYLEIGQELVADFASKSDNVRMIHQVWAWDWSKAVVVGGFNVLLPIGFFMSWLNMKVRRWKGRPNSEARFTPMAERILAELRLWNWASVLCKICVLGEVFFVLQVGVAKVTYIFLSWLNTELAGMPFETVVGLALVIGYSMFLLPPVPGLPVYVFVGIVVSERGRLTPGIGYEGGVAIALAMSFGMKQVACVSQYMIGFFLGKSVRVQQLIGVDKVVTRGIEKILKEPGLSLGKVSILVGGPDWPTSVTCGILRLNVPRMVWGTCPVFVVIAPCVLAGAFLGRVTPGEDSIWNLLSDAAIGTAALVNGFSMLLAFYKTAVMVRRYEKELAAPRPEHAKVAELTERDQARHEAYVEVTKWDSLDVRWKAFLSAAAIMHLGSAFTFGLLNEACFEDFSVNSKIGAPQPEGLGGDPFKIVKAPLGWLPIGAFFAATVMHTVFVKRMGRLAARRLLQGDGGREDEPTASI